MRYDCPVCYRPHDSPPMFRLMEVKNGVKWIICKGCVGARTGAATRESNKRRKRRELFDGVAMARAIGGKNG